MLDYVIFTLKELNDKYKSYFLPHKEIGQAVNQDPQKFKAQFNEKLYQWKVLLWKEKGNPSPLLPEEIKKTPLLDLDELSDFISMRENRNMFEVRSELYRYLTRIIPWINRQDEIYNSDFDYYGIDEKSLVVVNSLSSLMYRDLVELLGMKDLYQYVDIREENIQFVANIDHVNYFQRKHFLMEIVNGILRQEEDLKQCESVDEEELFRRYALAIIYPIVVTCGSSRFIEWFKRTGERLFGHDAFNLRVRSFYNNLLYQVDSQNPPYEEYENYIISDLSDNSETDLDYQSLLSAQLFSPLLLFLLRGKLDPLNNLLSEVRALFPHNPGKITELKRAIIVGLYLKINNFLNNAGGVKEKFFDAYLIDGQSLMDKIYLEERSFLDLWKYFFCDEYEDVEKLTYSSLDKEMQRQSAQMFFHLAFMGDQPVTLFNHLFQLIKDGEVTASDLLSFSAGDNWLPVRIFELAAIKDRDTGLSILQWFWGITNSMSGCNNIRKNAMTSGAWAFSHALENGDLDVLNWIWEHLEKLGESSENVRKMRQSLLINDEYYQPQIEWSFLRVLKSPIAKEDEVLSTLDWVIGKIKEVYTPDCINVDNELHKALIDALQASFSIGLKKVARSQKVKDKIYLFYQEYFETLLTGLFKDQLSAVKVNLDNKEFELSFGDGVRRQVMDQKNLLEFYTFRAKLIEDHYNFLKLVDELGLKRSDNRYPCYITLLNIHKQLVLISSSLPNNVDLKGIYPVDIKKMIEEIWMKLSSFSVPEQPGQSRDVQHCERSQRDKRDINLLCIDSSNEEDVIKEDDELRIKELFNTANLVEKVENIEFYEQLFKISQLISRGRNIDQDIEESFIKKIKSVDPTSIDPEIRDIVKEMKNNLDNEKIKNILRRSGVAEKIGKVAESASLAFTVFLVGKHIANANVEGLGYDALNLLIMPKIGEKISEKIFQLGGKLNSRVLKGFAPVMGRAIGNFAAFLGLAESIKARQSATDPVDIKIADLNIATNSIFIAADVPAVVTETMSAIGMEAGIIGEFAGPLGMAVSVSVIIVSQFVEANLEVEKLAEQINLTDQEKRSFYWDFFLDRKIPDYIERDIGVEKIYGQYISKILSQFKGGYDKIAISLPHILVTEEEYATNSHYRVKKQIALSAGDAWSAKYGDRCHAETRVVNSEIDFTTEAIVRNPFYTNNINYNSRLVPRNIEGYSIVCGPSEDNIAVQIINKNILANLPIGSCDSGSPNNNMKLSRAVKRLSLSQKNNSDCYNMVLYRKSRDHSSSGNALFYVSQDISMELFNTDSMDVIFHGKNISISDQGVYHPSSKARNRYYFTNELNGCSVYKEGWNFFHITKGDFLCDLGGSSIGQSNLAIVKGNFTDSNNIHSVIGDEHTNYIQISHAAYVDGKGGNDVVAVQNFTTVKGYFGDFILGKSLTLLPVNINEIGKIVSHSRVSVYNKKNEFIGVDKNTLLKTADGFFITPTRVENMTYIVTDLHAYKSLNGNIVLENELSHLGKIRNANFNITKQLSSTNYDIILGDSNNNIFYTDKSYHNFYWETTDGANNLYLFNRVNANITIAKASGILDFRQLSSSLDKMPFIKNSKGEVIIDNIDLHITLLPDYKDIKVTFDGEEYYKFQNDELERDYCSHSLKVDGRLSINGTELFNHHNCFMFASDKVLFLKLNQDLVLLSTRGFLSISDYYSSVHKNLDLSIRLNDDVVMKPKEFLERADTPNSLRYYRVGEQGLRIYHNQPINKNYIGLIDLKDKSILDCVIKIIGNHLSLSHKNDTLIKVENWKTYQPEREMIFAFNDATVSNSKCIASTCNSEDVIVEFNKEKAVQQLFDAVKQNNLGKVRNLLSIGIDINIRDRRGWAPLHWAVQLGSLDIVECLVERGADVNAPTVDGKTPLDIARDKGYDNIVNYLEEEPSKEREKPVQRKRRHHHGDHNSHHLSRKLHSINSSNQPEIVASSGTRPSFWINNFFSWVKSSISGLLDSKSSTTTKSPISQIDVPIDVNGTIMLLDMLIRKVTGQKYVSTADQSISPLEAQGYALNITKEFEKVVEQAGLKSGVSMHRLNIDYMGMQKEITRKVMSGKFNEISGILNSHLEKACPGREAGCPGKLSEKRFNEFMAKFNKGLDVTLNQSIEQVLHNRGDTLEVNNIEEQQGPRSYLNNTSIQGHLTRNKVKLIS